MQDQGQAPADLSRELDLLRRRVAELERAEEERRQLLGELQGANERLLTASLRERDLASEAEHRAAELDAIIASFPDGLIIYNAQGELIRTNAAAAALVGFPVPPGVTRDQLAARLSLETPEGKPFSAGEAPGERALRGETVQALPTVLHRPDGSISWISVSAAPIRGGGGELLGTVLALRDVSTQHELTVERERLLAAEHAARERAEAAARAHEEFLGAAAHELKTPVTNVRGFADLALRRLQREDPTPQQLRETLQTIVQQSDRLSRLVNEVLDLSSLDAGQLALRRRPADLAQLVRQAAASAEAGTRQRQVRIEVPAMLPADVDVERLQQALVNLLENALKFGPRDRPVQLSLSEPAPSQAHIEVRDYGPGVPPERRGQLFSRFYQAQTGRPFSGLGLGLYYARAIVELHGGRIAAEFPSEGGTRIAVELPTGR